MEKSEVRKEFIGRFSKNMGYVRELKRDFSLLQEVFSSPEFREIVKEEITNRAREEFAKQLNTSGGDTHYAARVKEEFNLSEELIKPIVEQTFVDYLSKGDTSSGIAISDGFSLPETFVQEVSEKSLTNNLANGEIQNVIKIKDACKELHLPEEFINSSGVKSVAKEGFIKVLSSSAKKAMQIKNLFHFSDEFIDSAAQQAIIQILQQDDFGDLSIFSSHIKNAIKIKDEMLSQELTQYPELQDIAKQKLVNCLSIGDVNRSINMKESFNLSIDSPEVQSAAEKGFIGLLSKGHSLACIDRLKEVFRLSEEFVKSPEVQSAAEKGFSNYLKDGAASGALEIQEQYNLSEQFIESPEIKMLAEEGFIKGISDYNSYSGQIGIQYVHKWEEMEKIKDQFDLERRFLDSPEVMSALKKRLWNRFYHFYYRANRDGQREKQEEMRETMEKFGWSEDLVDYILKTDYSKVFN